MADELIVTVPELSLWVTPEHDSTAIDVNDPWANAVLIEAANVVRSAVSATVSTTWLSPSTTPSKARTICLRVAMRTYKNPDLIISEGATGPIGGDTYAQAAALGTELSDRERLDLEALELVDDSTSPTGGLFTLSMTGQGNAVAPETIFVIDDQQTNIGDRMPWEIPYLNGEEFDTVMTPEQP